VVRGVISVGTNSTRLLIVAGDEVVVAQSVGTRLGRGLDKNGALDPEARAHTLAVIGEYAVELRRHAAVFDVIATSALRRATDAADFVHEVERSANVAPRIISGDEEAAYSFAGATWGYAPGDRIGVLDVGGGSSEFALGTPATIERTISLEIGAVRLSETFPALLGECALDGAARAALIAQARAHAEATLAPLAGFERCPQLLAVGGTAFTAGAMLTGDPRRNGARIDRTQRLHLLDDLLARDLAARRELPHIRPQRADILAAGLIIIDTSCDLLGIDALHVSHADLLLGYLRSPAYRARPTVPIG